jgi:hypothetical protein
MNGHNGQLVYIYILKKFCSQQCKEKWVSSSILSQFNPSLRYLKIFFYQLWMAIDGINKFNFENINYTSIWNVFPTFLQLVNLYSLKSKFWDLQNTNKIQNKWSSSSNRKKVDKKKSSNILD